MLKGQKGITLVALVVTIIVLIILAGVSINLTLGDNGLITIAKKAKENMELTQIEEQTKLNELYTQIGENEGGFADSYYDAIQKLDDFKKAIADYIEQAGGIKPAYTAEKEIFGESITGIVAEVTKDATATADNIAEGKTAWVKGEKIIGTGKDIQSYYEEGKDSVIKMIYSNVATIYNTQWSSSSTLSGEAKSPAGSGYATKMVNGRSNNIYLAKTPKEEEGYLVSLDFSHKLSALGGGSVGASVVKFHLCDENDNIITTWEYKPTPSKMTNTKSMLDYKIEGKYVYIKYEAVLYAYGFTDSVMAWTSIASFNLDNSLKLHYITDTRHGDGDF